MVAALHGYGLIHEGWQALADVEENGIHIDLDYVETTILKLDNRINTMRSRLDNTKFVKKWRGVYGHKFKWDSDEQLGDMLYNEMGLGPIKYTNDGGHTPSVDHETLELLSPKLPLLKGFLKMRKMSKCKDTYLAGILRETVDEYLHPFFNLHTVATFRSSSSKPNFQNMPIRDKMQGELIRRAFIPRPGRMLMEVDYSGIEVCIAACYHKDPNMIAYIKDPTKDMHRDMAAQCYKLPTEEVTSDIRYCGKNCFVFPQFYGDWFKSCAGALWASVDTRELVCTDGTKVRDHLGSHTINLDTLKKFEDHIEMVEDDFWNNRFAVYGQWKEDHYDEYLRRGYVDMKTGFRCGGIMQRNDVSNYPVQGAAFHCLLWSLIQVNKELKAAGLSTLIVGQIHDSIVLDVVPEELEQVLAIVRRVMCVEIRKAWPWIIVPLDVDVEITDIDASWFEKKKMGRAA